jgi:hypothetical protein
MDLPKGQFKKLGQISYDCEKVTVQTCRAVMVLCPNILIGWEVLTRYMIGWEDFLVRYMYMIYIRFPTHAIWLVEKISLYGTVAVIFHTHTKSALYTAALVKYLLTVIKINNPES